MALVENKKHIDLSAEPLIIVCASGSPKRSRGHLKDVAIFKAHKSAVVVLPDEKGRFNAIADAVIPCPRAAAAFGDPEHGGGPPLPAVHNVQHRRRRHSSSVRSRATSI